MSVACCCLVVGVRCSLFVVRRLLVVGCSSCSAVCCLLFVACVGCCLVFVAR